MRTKIDSNFAQGERLLPVLLGCILLAVGAILISTDVYTSVVICTAIFVVVAIAGCYLPYFHPEIFGGDDSSKSPERAPHRERSLGVRVKIAEDRTVNPDCSMPDSRQNNGLGSESMLDAALDRIILGLDRDLEIRR